MKLKNFLNKNLNLKDRYDSFNIEHTPEVDHQLLHHIRNRFDLNPMGNYALSQHIIKPLEEFLNQRSKIAYFSKFNNDQINSLYLDVKQEFNHLEDIFDKLSNFYSTLKIYKTATANKTKLLTNLKTVSQLNTYEKFNQTPVQPLPSDNNFGSKSWRYTTSGDQESSGLNFLQMGGGVVIDDYSDSCRILSEDKRQYLQGKCNDSTPFNVPSSLTAKLYEVPITKFEPKYPNVMGFSKKSQKRKMGCSLDIPRLNISQNYDKIGGESNFSKKNNKSYYEEGHMNQYTKLRQLKCKRLRINTSFYKEKLNESNYIENVRLHTLPCNQNQLKSKKNSELEVDGSIDMKIKCVKGQDLKKIEEKIKRKDSVVIEDKSLMNPYHYELANNRDMRNMISGKYSKLGKQSNFDFASSKNDNIRSNKESRDCWQKNGQVANRRSQHGQPKDAKAFDSRKIEKVCANKNKFPVSTVEDDQAYDSGICIKILDDKIVCELKIVPGETMALSSDKMPVKKGFASKGSSNGLPEVNIQKNCVIKLNKQIGKLNQGSFDSASKSNRKNNILIKDRLIEKNDQLEELYGDRRLDLAEEDQNEYEENNSKISILEEPIKTINRLQIPMNFQSEKLAEGVSGKNGKMGFSNSELDLTSRTEQSMMQLEDEMRKGGKVTEKPSPSKESYRSLHDDLIQTDSLRGIPCNLNTSDNPGPSSHKKSQFKTSNYNIHKSSSGTGRSPSKLVSSKSKKKKEHVHTIGNELDIGESVLIKPEVEEEIRRVNDAQRVQENLTPEQVSKYKGYVFEGNVAQVNIPDIIQKKMKLAQLPSNPSGFVIKSNDSFSGFQAKVQRDNEQVNSGKDGLLNVSLNKISEEKSDNSVNNTINTNMKDNLFLSQMRTKNHNKRSKQMNSIDSKPDQNTPNKGLESNLGDSTSLGQTKLTSSPQKKKTYNRIETKDKVLNYKAVDSSGYSRLRGILVERKKPNEIELNEYNQKSRQNTSGETKLEVKPEPNSGINPKVFSLQKSYSMTEIEKYQFIAKNNIAAGEKLVEEAKRTSYYQSVVGSVKTGSCYDEKSQCGLSKGSDYRSKRKLSIGVRSCEDNLKTNQTDSLIEMNLNENPNDKDQSPRGVKRDSILVGKSMISSPIMKKYTCNNSMDASRRSSTNKKLQVAEKVENDDIILVRDQLG